ncbi:TrmB family transcriptional regulator, partial [Candidatus Bathyarchaeota archaeon]|nr:TrmB family transcriptional regulator [Candidatus Bathyarchaeota archaeon]
MNERIRHLLRKVGLTEYEAEAYLLLLEKGALTAKQISYGAQIPYSKVYQILNSLEKKGWVEVARKRPSKYFPKSPETALMITRKALENEWMQVEAALIEDLSPLYEKLKTQEKYDIWILRGLTNIFPKFKEMIKKCRKEILIALPSVKEELLTELYPVLGSLSNGRLKMRFLVSSQIS